MDKRYLAVMLLLTGTLAACNNTESALNIQPANKQADATQPAQPNQPAQGAAATGTPATSTQPAANTSQLAAGDYKAALKSVRLSIAPIVGAPLNIVTPLTHRINDDARNKGMELVASNNGNATHVLKGYFSALAENGRTTVFYVWDVVDHAGNRVHRIQGQEATAGSASDSWSVVGAPVMEKIADRTMQELSTWIASNRP